MPTASDTSRWSFGFTALCLQACFIGLFAVLAQYHEDSLPAADGDSGNFDRMYPMFQDVHVMIFVGFGFLMTFMRWHGFSSVGNNLLIAGLVIQWGLIVNGLLHLHHWKFTIDLQGLLCADFACAAVLISFGAVLGRVSPLQCVALAIIEIPIFAVNEHIGLYKFKAADLGGSMFVHAFGAYFGMAAAWMLAKKGDGGNSNDKSCYASDMFAMIGSLFLWLYWPSFNSALATGAAKHRAVINTYLSLAGSTIAAFGFSALFEKGKFEMSHVQNAPLAGGVAVGTVADMLIRPHVAVLIGFGAGAVSVIGYAVFSPRLRSRGFLDTCGVHNLHGMPGLISGLVGILFSWLASADDYKQSLHEIFPARANATRSATGQAGNQAAALGVTLICAVLGGLLTGLVLRLNLLDLIPKQLFYNDKRHWLVPDDLETKEFDDDDDSSEPLKKNEEAAPADSRI